MDAFKFAGGGSCFVTAIGCLCALSICGGFITFIVYLGMYAFANPNAAAWYGETMSVDGVLTPGLYADPTTATVPLVDIHGQFVTWFLWGFIQAILPFATVIFAVTCSLISQTLGNAVISIFGCGMGCGGLAWWITGMVWRFSNAGKYASGDIVPEGMDAEKTAAWETGLTADGSLFQYSSGNFMYIYYMIIWIILGVGCGCSLLATILTCICKR